MNFQKMFQNKFFCIALFLIGTNTFAAETAQQVMVFNVRNSPYNATLGLGGDNSAAIQLAINHAIQSRTSTSFSAIVYIPKGSYLITQPIYIGDSTVTFNSHNLKIVGDGMESTNFLIQGNGGFVFRGGPGNPTVDFGYWYANSTWNNVIQDMSFRKNTGTGGCPLILSHAIHPIVENIKILTQLSGANFSCAIRAADDYPIFRNVQIDAGSGSIDTGICLKIAAGSFDGAKITGCAMQWCGIAIYMQARGANSITNTTIGSSLITGIKVAAKTSGDIWSLVIRDNQMEGNGATCVDHSHPEIKTLFQHKEIWIENSPGCLAKGVIVDGNFFNLEGMRDINNNISTNPYDISDPAQLTQCTFNRNSYRPFDGSSQVSEGFAVGVFPAASASAASPMLNVGGNAAVNGNLNNSGNISTSGQLYVAGNTGLGTTNIGSKLQINGNSAIGYSASTAAPANGLAVSGNVGVGTATVGSKLQVNGNTAIGYSASTAGPANGLAVSGNVGIGTATPSCRLSLGGGTGDRLALWDNGDGINYGGFGGQVNLYQWFVPNSANDITFGYGKSASMTRNVTFKGNGNVGIGVTSPSCRLSLGSGTGDRLALWDAGDGTNYAGFGVQVNLYQMYVPSSSNDITFGYGKSASMTRNVTFKGNGNVGIGKTNPRSKLSVVGLPTSATGLTSGDIWRDSANGNVLKIVP